jgi:hypothetical protein
VSLEQWRIDGRQHKQDNKMCVFLSYVFVVTEFCGKLLDATDCEKGLKLVLTIQIQQVVIHVHGQSVGVTFGQNM